MAFSNLSCENLNYPTAILFKSSKLIPVMIGGMIFLDKKYNFFEILSVILIVIGLFGISLSDKFSQNDIKLLGISFSVLSLIFDAVASNFQEKAFHEYKATQNEVISMMYLTGSIILFFVSLITGHTSRGIQMCAEDPIIIGGIIAFSICGAVGVQFVYLLMNCFGSLITVMVTSLRKGTTIAISYLLFPGKKFTIFHMISILTIASGITLNYWAKNSYKKEIAEERMPLIDHSKQNENKT